MVIEALRAGFPICPIAGTGPNYFGFTPWSLSEERVFLYDWRASNGFYVLSEPQILYSFESHPLIYAISRRA